MQAKLEPASLEVKEKLALVLVVAVGGCPVIEVWGGVASGVGLGGVGAGAGLVGIG